jgi:hypothetical protein
MSIRQHEQQGCRAGPMTTATGGRRTKVAPPFCHVFWLTGRRAKGLGCRPSPSLSSLRGALLYRPPTRTGRRAAAAASQPLSLLSPAAGWSIKTRSAAGRKATLVSHFISSGAERVPSPPSPIISTTSLRYHRLVLSLVSASLSISPPPIVG